MANSTPDELPADKLLLANPRYHLVRLNVLSSTQISARTSAIIKALTANDNPPPPPSSTTPALPADSPGPTLTPIIRLSAKAKVGSKLITIVDIAKRELASQGLQCYQYNALSSTLSQVPRNPTTSSDKPDDDEDDGDAFETMGPADSGLKLRKVPVMTIYLSKAPIKELATAFG